MLRDARELIDGQKLEADVCIAGAGAAGITLARDLSNHGLSVCLLESGGLQPDEAQRDLCRGQSTGLPYGDLSGCRLRYFGGTTGHWQGWCRPLEREVLETRDWVTRGGWPFGMDELRPHYLRAQRTCELGALEYEGRVIAQRSGRGTLPLDPERVQTIAYQVGPPTRFGTRYRDELESDPNVEVYLHANLINITLDETLERMAGFECATLEGLRFTARADRYVLALGGIENARMLLASNGQRESGVANSHDLIGRNFMEHPHLSQAAYAVVRDVGGTGFYNYHDVDTFDELSPEGRKTTVFGALGLSEQQRAEHRLLPMSCAVRRVDPERVDKQDLTGRISSKVLGPLLAQSANRLALLELYVRTEQSPVAESRVRLSDERDALGLPRATLDWRLGEQDLQHVLKTLRLIAREFGRSGVGRVWVPLDAAGDYDPPSIAGGCHHMGATRMGDDPKTTVVDSNCHVHECAGLYIAGSSVFPRCGFANPTLTIVALAHRLADHLAGELNG